MSVTISRVPSIFQGYRDQENEELRIALIVKQGQKKGTETGTPLSK